MSRRARGGHESLHTLYGGEAPIGLSENVSENIGEAGTSSFCEEEQEKIHILRNVVQEYLKSWDKD